MRLLIVGSLEGHIAAAGKIALSRGAKVAQVGTIDAAMDALRAGQGADLLLCDVGLDIGQLIDRLKTERINLPVVACGIGTDANTAVRAIKAGAKDYLPLPPDAELIAAILAAVAEENSAFIYRDPAMREVLKLADQIAPSDASVLIAGESGTGKEVMARYLHGRSKRASKPFISVNCAAIPEHLLESELFGHERGAFTGADRSKPGMFEVAERGTLFLDEIGELPLSLQAKLLRALQERQIRRVGGTRFLPVDVRLVSATNRDLAESVRKREFRDDLFYRVNVIQITLPPLRERSGDVALLAYHFLGRYGKNRERPLTGFDPEALGWLETHSWPGNVRELQNVVERACALADGPTVGVRDLPEHVRGRNRSAPVAPVKDLPLRQAREEWLRTFTEEYLTDLLRRHGGNISQAAKTAGVDRKTLHRLLARHLPRR